MQVNDTVRAVHTAGAIRRAFFATVLSVQPTIPEDIGTNGEPTVTLGFIDPAMLHLVGGIDFPKAFRRITTVRHVSHDEVQTNAAEYCWTDVLPNDGGIIVIASLNMDDLNEPAAQPAEPEDTIGTIVYINHNNGLEVFHSEANGFVVRVSTERVETFSDLFSAKVFVDAQPADSIEGSPRDLLGHQMFGENSEEVARGRYEIHLKEQAAAAAAIPENFAVIAVDAIATEFPKPSAADLDAHAAEDQAKAETAAKEVEIVDRGEEHGAERYAVVVGHVQQQNFATREEAVFYLAQMEEHAKSVTTIAAELPPETPDALAAL